MKVVTDYLKRAVEFEALAAREKNAWFKVDLVRQAAAFRKLAEKRAKAEKDLGITIPNALLIQATELIE